MMLRQMNLLPVADRTVGQLERRFNVILRHELAAQFFLIDWRFPPHLEHLIPRPEVLLGMPMAFETPLHVHVGMFPCQRHQVHAAMTSFAANTFIHVDTVIKVDEIGKVVDAIPSDRLIFTQAGAHRLQHVAVSPNLLVTVHAGRSWRDSRERADLNCRMTIPAVDADAADMMLMAEWNRLIQRDSFTGGVRRINHRRPAPGHCDHGENACEYRQARNGIRRSFEYLRHRSTIAVAVRKASCLPDEDEQILQVPQNTRLA